MKSTRLVVGLHDGDSSAPSSPLPNIRKSAPVRATTPQDATTTTQKAVQPAQKAASPASDDPGDTTFFGYSGQTPIPVNEWFRWPDGQQHFTVVDGKRTLVVPPSRQAEYFRNPALVEFVRKSVESRIPAGEHWTDHTTVSDLNQGYRAMVANMEHQAVEARHTEQEQATHKSVTPTTPTLEMSPAELFRRAGELQTQGAKIAGYDYSFVADLTDGRVKAERYNQVCKSLRETEERIAKGGPLRPVPTTNLELLNRAFALQQQGVTVPGMTYTSVSALENGTISPADCSALLKAVVTLEEAQSGRTPSSPAADTLKKGAPAPEPPSRPQAAPKATPAPPAPTATTKPQAAPKAPIAAKPSTSLPENHQMTALEHGEDMPKSEKPFDPKPTGQKQFHTFKAEPEPGAEHPNCHCAATPSDGQSPAQMLVHPDACPKCRAGAQAFNERAAQEFQASASAGASATPGMSEMEGE